MKTKILLFFIFIIIITTKNVVINLLTPLPSTIIKNNKYRLSGQIIFRQKQNHDNNNNCNNVSWWGRGGPPQKLYLDDAIIPSPSNNSTTTTNAASYEEEQNSNQYSRHNTRRLSSTKFKDLYKWNATFYKRYYTTTTTTTITNNNNNYNNNSTIEEDPIKFLCSYNYTIEEIQQMIKTKKSSTKINEIFTSINVKKDLYPKIQFLLHTLDGGEIIKNNKIIISNKIKKYIPLSYYTLNLEKTLAPKHAYLMYCNIISHHDNHDGSGSTKLLLHDINRWNDFLKIIKKSDLAFISTCKKWYYSDYINNNNNNNTTMIEPNLLHFQEFQRIFCN